MVVFRRLIWMRTIYTDGSCLGNPWPGGWAALMQAPDGTEKILTWWAAYTTNNQMELQAAISALRWLIERNSLPWSGAMSVTLVTDSTYLQQGITSWIVVWKRRQRRRAKGGKLVENVAFWKELDELIASFPDLQRQRTKAHVGTDLNERVDRLARKEAERYV